MDSDGLEFVGAIPEGEDSDEVSALVIEVPAWGSIIDGGIDRLDGHEALLRACALVV